VLCAACAGRVFARKGATDEDGRGGDCCTRAVARRGVRDRYEAREGRTSASEGAARGRRHGGGGLQTAGRCFTSWDNARLSETDRSRRFFPFSCFFSFFDFFVRVSCAPLPPPASTRSIRNGPRTGIGDGRDRRDGDGARSFVDCPFFSSRRIF